MVLYATWREWCETTSVGAANKTVSARSTLFRLLWVGVFVAGAVGTTLSVINVFADYFEYDVDTTVSLQFNSYVDFPAITVCNQNRIDCINFAAVLSTCVEEDNYANCSFVEQTNFDGGVNDVSEVVEKATYLYQLACNDSSEIYDKLSDQAMNAYNESWTNSSTVSSRRKRAIEQDDLGNQDESDVLDNELMINFMFLHVENRKLIGHDFDDLVQACSFKGRNCLKSTQWMQFNVPSYGNCYLFNSLMNFGDERTGRVASLTGSKFGLKLVLKAQQDNYMVNSFTKEAGARVSIHNTSMIPLMDEHGFDVEAGKSTSFAIKRVSISRMESPYTSHCFSDWTQTNYTGYIPVNDINRFQIGWDYSLPLCQRVCLLSTFDMSCNCTHPNFLDDDYDRRSERACMLNKGEQDYECVSAIYNELDGGRRNCSCSVECDEDDLEVATSISDFPSSKYEPYAQSTYGYDSSVDSMTSNLMMVRIYFSTLNVKNIKESAVYESLTSSEFLSSLGGALSLYLGITIASLLESLELLFGLVKNVAHRNSKKH